MACWGPPAEEFPECRAVWERQRFPHHTSDSVPRAEAVSSIHKLTTKIWVCTGLGDGPVSDSVPRAEAI